MSRPTADVLAAFGRRGTVVACDRLPGGHIHGTWRVRTSGGDDVVCQSVNEHVFRDLAAVESNLDRVDRHLAGTGLVAPLRRTASGAVHWRDDAGTAWRVTAWVEGSFPARGRADAGATAHAFGRFVRALTDLPGPALRETIPGFHDLPGRIATFEAHVAADRVGRLRHCADVVAAARRLLSTGDVAADLGALPATAVHNDAKVDNLLVDADGRPLAIVDLDTVMPGSPLFDLGELLRTGTTDAPEDAADPSSIELDEAAYDAIVAGFGEGVGSALDPLARSLLPIAGPRMALENAIRFLGDHLDGDRYFAVHREGQNLDRARTQLRVAELLVVRGGARA